MESEERGEGVAVPLLDGLMTASTPDSWRKMAPSEPGWCWERSNGSFLGVVAAGLWAPWGVVPEDPVGAALWLSAAVCGDAGSVVCLGLSSGVLQHHQMTWWAERHRRCISKAPSKVCKTHGLLRARQRRIARLSCRILRPSQLPVDVAGTCKCHQHLQASCSQPVYRGGFGRFRAVRCAQHAGISHPG